MKKARLFRLGESSKSAGLLKLLVSLLISVCSLALFAGVSFGATDGDIYENLRQSILDPFGMRDYFDFSQLIREDNLEEIKNAIQNGADVNVEGIWGGTILMDAAQFSSNPEVIATLIKSGADVNKRDDFRQLTALMIAAMENSNPEVIRALIQGGADVNAESNGETALTIAREYNENPEVVKVLEEAVEEARSVNVAAGLATSTSGRSISDEAFLELCKRGDLREIENAIKSGANVNAAGENGTTALMFAAAILSSNTEVITALIQSGADVNARSENGGIALMFAAVNNKNPEVITALIQNGADVNAIDKNEATALMVGVQHNNNNPEVITALIQGGVDVNAKDKNGVTALMWAARNKNPEVITALIQGGADVNDVDIFQKTALMIAREYNENPEVVKVLEEAVEGARSVNVAAGSARSTSGSLTGLDVNPAGFGPVVKGFQLGEPTTITDFVNKSLDLLGNAWSFSYRTEGSRYVVVRSMNNGMSWEILRHWDIEVLDSFRGSLSDFLKICEMDAEKNPDAMVIILEGVSNFDLAGNLLVVPGALMMATKGNNSGQFRYISLQFRKSDFGADNMPFGDYVQTLINSYQLGTLYSTRERGYQTGEAENYQNGWQAAVEQNGLFGLFVSGVQGQTRFD